jgi:hypothetical protein
MIASMMGEILERVVVPNTGPASTHRFCNLFMHIIGLEIGQPTIPFKKIC